MKRNCNLELQLSSNSLLDGVNLKEGSGESPNQPMKKNKQMTIFYHGKVGAYDVTELQARSILMLASQETEQRMRKEGRSPTSSSIEHRLCSPNPVSGLSMKASLQKFLQKRKLRVLANSPYHRC